MPDLTARQQESQVRELEAFWTPSQERDVCTGRTQRQLPDDINLRQYSFDSFEIKLTLLDVCAFLGLTQDLNSLVSAYRSSRHSIRAETYLSCFEFACRGGHKATRNWVLANIPGTLFDRKGMFTIACRYGQKAVAEAIYSSTEERHQLDLLGVLIEISESGQPVLVQWLESLLDKNDKFALACYRGEESLAAEIHDEDKPTSLFRGFELAAQMGHLPIIKMVFFLLPLSERQSIASSLSLETPKCWSLGVCELIAVLVAQDERSLKTGISLEGMRGAWFYRRDQLNKLYGSADSKVWCPMLTSLRGALKHPEFIEACKVGDLKIVQSIYNSQLPRVKPDLISSNQFKAFQVALLYDYADLLEWLLSVVGSREMVLKSPVIKSCCEIAEVWGSHDAVKFWREQSLAAESSAEAAKPPHSEPRPC